MNKSGDIGTKTETAVVKVLQQFWPNAERRRLKGAGDQGDVITVPELVWSVKGGKAAERASDAQIDQWLDELWQQIKNADAHVGVLVVKRKGIGYANAHRWWAIPINRVERVLTSRYYLGELAKALSEAGF